VLASTVTPRDRQQSAPSCASSPRWQRPADPRQTQVRRMALQHARQQHCHRGPAPAHQSSQASAARTKCPTISVCAARPRPVSRNHFACGKLLRQRPLPCHAMLGLQRQDVCSSIKMATRLGVMRGPHLEVLELHARRREPGPHRYHPRSATGSHSAGLATLAWPGLHCELLPMLFR